jgi:hydroxylamine oxidation protein HaoB
MEAGDAPTVARDAEISVVPAQHRRQPFALGRQRRVPTELHLTAQLLEFADHPRALGLPHDHEPPFPGCSAVMTATPLGWRNAVTEPVFFADIDPADTAKVLAAIREHAPTEAVVFAWWDMSCRIRALAGRQAPLDDPLARGLLTPSAWTVNVAAINENQRAYWGAGVPSGEGEAFAKFIDTLLMDEARGVAALVEIAGGREVFVAVHLSDAWKAAAARPDLLSIAYRDFPGGGDTHGVMKAAREWLQENGIEGGFAVEPMGGAIRLHYLPRKTDSARLLARLLPFSTSNPLKLERLELVYQHKGYWIYKLNAIKG